MNQADYIFNPERVCGAILEEPRIVKGKLERGALMLACPDKVIEAIPELKDYYYIVERRGWNGMTDAYSADIKLVEDSTKWNETREQLPQAILLDVAGGDFVNTDIFKPLGIPKKYTAIQVARWCELKRHNMFVGAASLMPNHKFVKFGNFYRGGTEEELGLKKQTVALGKKIGANIYYPYASLKNNDGLANPHEVNRYINQSMMGVLTSQCEGNNRFKGECIAANIPILIPADIEGGAAKKHMNGLTGIIFEPTPHGLAKAMDEVLKKYTSFKPREYVESHLGMGKSIEKITEALIYLAARDGSSQLFNNIYWDGRENTLIQHDKIYDVIKNSMRRVQACQK